MMRSVAEGKVQLPDFQRGWVWTDDHIRSLLASVSLSYPIGAVMMLRTGNPDVRFKMRPLEGATPPAGQNPDLLLLDGQQRLTSLFQALASGKVVDTRDSRDKAVKRWYYIDMQVATDPEKDREDAFISVPEDRKVKNFRGEVIADYSTPELERGAGVFPVALILSDYEDWAEEYRDLSHTHKDHWKKFRKSVIELFRDYQIPVITLDKSTPKEAVCQVFEKVNTGGVSLTVFELLTATFAADDYHLRDAWYGDEAQNKVGIQQKLQHWPALANVESTDFLQAVTLLSTRVHKLKKIQSGKSEQEAPGISCKRKDILKLTLTDYLEYAGAVENGFLKAAKFLRFQNMFTARDLPYRTQLIPLAAALAVLGERTENVAVQDKLAQWYWCGVFGELYASATETRFAKDFPELLAWMDGGSEPDTVREANFLPNRLNDLRTRNSAAYKGVYALLMRDGAEDFRTGQAATDTAYFDESIDVHHIFPQTWCEKQGIPREIFDSVINKTPLSYKTNRKIGGSAPSSYLEKLQKEEDIHSERMDEILVTHIIDVSSLRGDNFQSFFDARRASLLARIAQAMQKPITQTDQ